MNYSQTQGGNVMVIAAVVSMVLGKFGISFLPEEIAMIIAALGVSISWYGRWKKGDLTPLGFKKY